ncbi:MAG: hypothetical protein IM550_06530 [Microcystis sp. M54BS1]|uniref:hypothetical protein n=1 Tax=unclassified Microcystis TaxID=2643300 RepID=UPI00257FA37A|nr:MULTISPECIES: hypothetical protein [unclassified Microcystis]MCA2504771.1 hypothetical protein [Microcystis sp. M62BS1]MCA2538896.1 hypothetical protein [Microcystis sp. M54BS1]MCA2548329.1 hypothetical protein [Microcystis sp. M53BS1]MCA2569420.1 hypothetical protein [Microcystis sp. M44BS1]MCA2596540.1 hypothetical protein [Microcystis sp. M38BS1]MCA2611983.1 hypothetical protein [Microcystis sp. M27BS1]
MKYNTYVDLLSSNPLKFSQNRGNSERLTDRKITSPIKPAISRIKANFGRNCQDKPSFAARGLKIAAQKSDFLGGVSHA